jgi:hypothetical protein
MKASLSFKLPDLDRRSNLTAGINRLPDFERNLVVLILKEK